MLDHVGLEVADFDRSRAFYEAALAPLGISVVMSPMPTALGFGSEVDGNNVEAVCHRPRAEGTGSPPHSI